jgi:hypothetical protein
MAGDPTKIVVGANGSLSIAPVGTAAPADEVVALNAAFKDVGIISEDGATFSNGKTVEGIKAWQSFHDVRKIVTGVETTVACVLREWSKQTTELALDGTVTEVSAGHYKLTPNAAEAVAEYAAVLAWVDGDKHYRLVIPRCSLADSVETNLTRSGPADLPITLGVLGSDGVDPWYLLTDDPAFDA